MFCKDKKKNKITTLLYCIRYPPRWGNNSWCNSKALLECHVVGRMNIQSQISFDKLLVEEETSTDQTGIEPSLSVDDAKQYLEQVIAEVKTHKGQHNWLCIHSIQSYLLSFNILECVCLLCYRFIITINNAFGNGSKVP